jgi:hypothetical protein
MWRHLDPKTSHISTSLHTIFHTWSWGIDASWRQVTSIWRFIKTSQLGYAQIWIKSFTGKWKLQMWKKISKHLNIKFWVQWEKGSQEILICAHTNSIRQSEKRRSLISADISHEPQNSVRGISISWHLL